MTDCTVDFSLEVPTESGDPAPSAGYLWFQQTARRDLEGTIVLPEGFPVYLDENGHGSVTLAPSTDEWFWMVREYVAGGTRRYVAVPNGPGPIDYDHLVDIDPSTLDPTAPIPPVWKSYVDNKDAQLQVAIDDEGALARNANNLTSGTVDVARIPSSIARAADLTTEADTRAAADLENAQDIVDETTRAQGVEGGLRTDVDAAQAALTDKADLVGGLVPTAQIPAIAIGTGQAVANRAAMLALTNVQQGDFVSITATADKGTYILNDPDPSIFGHWMPLSVPTDVVQSVNGQSGPVVLSKADIGLPLADNTSDATKPVSAAQAAAIAAAIAALAKSTDGSFSLAAPTGVGLEFVITANGLDDIRFNGTSL